MTATNPEAPPLRVAVIGYSFMGRIHTQAWLTAGRFFDLGTRVEVAAVCGRDATAAAEFAERFGIPRVFTDWRDVVADPGIDVVDICTPGDTHAEIAIAALDAGTHVLCEKPLANSVADAERMTEAAEAAAARGVRSLVGFNYRRTPALALARRLVEQGRIGEIRHIRATYLQDWIADPAFPLVWRLRADVAGSGALGDIGAHIVDLAAHVTGHRLSGVSALTETFVKQRPLAGSSAGLAATADGVGGEARMGEVTVDDAVVVIARTDRGALATFEATRFATGRRNAMAIEVNGSRGSFRFDFERMNELEFHDHTLPAAEHGFRRILATERDHPYAGSWWPPGHGLGYEQTFVHEVADFATAIVAGTPVEPSFRDGLYVQRVLDAIAHSAANDAAWSAV